MLYSGPTAQSFLIKRFALLVTTISSCYYRVDELRAYSSRRQDCQLSSGEHECPSPVGTQVLLLSLRLSAVGVRCRVERFLPDMQRAEVSKRDV